MIEKDNDTYLTLQEFMHEFLYEGVYNGMDMVEQDLRKGLPNEFIDGQIMYPREKCHRWYAGEKV